MRKTYHFTELCIIVPFFGTCLTSQSRRNFLHIVQKGATDDISTAGSLPLKVVTRRETSAVELNAFLIIPSGQAARVRIQANTKHSRSPMIQNFYLGPKVTDKPQQRNTAIRSFCHLLHLYSFPIEKNL